MHEVLVNALIKYYEMTTEILILLLLLFALESVFLPVARRLRLQADVTSRSSHNAATETGGGFLFFVAALVMTAFHLDETMGFRGYMPMLAGAAVLFAVSMYDDLCDLSPVFRLVVQIVVVAYVFSDVAVAGHYDIYLLILLCGVGFINGFNFMDGVNGMLAAYSVVTLATMLLLYHQCQWRWGAEVPELLIVSELVAVFVFAVFNFRHKAICFAGDVGSIVLGFFIVWLTVSYIILTADASIIVFLVVYGVDVVFTILQRLFRGDNILKPHRLHLYQLLVNNRCVSHLKVSVGYAAVQFVVNCGWFIMPGRLKWTYAIIVIVTLSTVYLSMKRNLMKN